MKDYIRVENIIVDKETHCSEIECKENGCCFPDCSKEIIEFNSIDAANKKLSDLKESGHNVDSLD